MRRQMVIFILAFANTTVFGQDAAAYLRIADSQALSGRNQQSLTSYRKMIFLNPKNLHAYEKLVEVYARLAMPSESADAYEKAADLMLATPLPREHTVRAEAPRSQLVASGILPVVTTKSGGGGGSSIDGLYLMTRFWAGSGLEIATYQFQNGTVVLNPIGSAKDLDLQAERTKHPNNIGAYRFEGEQLVLIFADGRHQAKFEPESKGCFGWDAGIFCPVEIFKQGTTLDGTFSGGASVGGGAVMSSITITFKRDGTYQRESVGTYSTQGATALSGGSVNTERGKYRVDGTALYLMPDSGNQTVVSTFPYDDGSPGPAPRSLYFSGGMLNRVH